MTPDRWQKIDNLFQAAVAQPPDQRATFLDETCDDDHELRREVEALLRSDAELDHEFDHIASGLAMEWAAATSRRDLLGKSLGHYRILASLGSGGMGEIYLAEDTKLNRKVALKFLPAQFTKDADRLRRFEQEARSASALNHPNIVTIYEIGQWQGDHFIATEYIEGETLREPLDKRRLSLAEMLDIGGQAASALAAAHAAGIVHRDIKPANIMLRGDGYIKLLDFGLAKLANANNDHDVTEAGRVMGTVNYMSPEQALAEPVDHRTDIFSLGVVLYELATGRRLFQGKSEAGIYDAILHHEPPSMRDSDPTLPPDFEGVVRHCLEKDREHRYQSAAQLRDDLKQIAQGARPIGAPVSLGKAKRRRAAGVAALALVLLAGGRWLVERSLRDHNNSATAPAKAWNAAEATAPAENSVAVLPFVNLSEDKGNEYFSDGVAEELLSVLQRIPGLHVAARTSAFSFKGQNATAQEIGQKLGVAYLVDGSVRKSGEVVQIAARLTRANSGTEIWSENFTCNVKDVFAVQTGLAQTIVSKLRGQVPNGAIDPAAKAAIQTEVQTAEKGGTKNAEAHQHYLQGHFYEWRNSEQATIKALAEFQKAVELDPEYALAWAQLATAHLWMCDYSDERGRAEWEAHLASARDAAARALGIEHDLPDGLRILAHIQLSYDFDWKGADDSVQRALRLAPADSRLVVAAGNVALAIRDRAEALALYRKAVDLDPDNPSARMYVAYHLALTRQFAESEAESARVIELTPKAPMAYGNLALSFLLQGRFEDAVAVLHDEETEWVRLCYMAMARWGQKRIPEANKALAEFIQKFADTSAMQICEVYAYRGEIDKAFDWLERSRRQRDSGLIGFQTDPFLENLHSDPRWNVFLRKMNLADDQLKVSRQQRTL